MAEAAFNPYHVWLGIPPQEQPANFYRLLSLPVLESNADVIDNAADRQTAHLRTFQSGKNSKLAEKLLNEVAAARVCLLDPQKKAAYDQRIQAWLAAQKAQAAAPQQAAPPQQATAQPSAGDWDNLLGDVASKPQKSVGSRQGAGASGKKAKQQPMAIFAVAGALLLAAAVIGIYALTRSPADGTLVLDWPADQREGAALTIDDAPVPLPAGATIERPAPPGEHRLTATRPLYQSWSATVTVAAGERHSVAIEWKPKAVVVLDWPVADRRGAELKVDGKPQPLSDHEPLELLVEPGEHTIRILRPNAEPVQTGVQVALGGRRTIAIPAAAVDASLLVQWPAADRTGTHLAIDGAETPPGKSSPEALEFTLKTGRHAVRITRPGFQPFEQTVDLAATDNKPLTPTWTPEVVQTSPQPVTPDVPVTPTPEPPKVTETAPAKKHPIPSADEQAKVAKQIDELYKPTHTAADAAKANEFYDLADKAQSPAERYMLLARGAELAAGAGDMASAFTGIDRLDGEYEIEPLEAKQRLLEKAVAAATTAEQLAALIAAAGPLLDQAIAADRYEAALAIALTTSKALSKRPAAAQLRKDTEDMLARRRRDIHMLEPLYAAAQKAQKTLETSPDDAEANLTVGRWYSFYKNDWPRGLPLLAKGKDEKLKALAQAELKPPATTDEQVQAADGWWDASSKEIAYVRDAIRLHAGDLYTTALPGLTSPLAKVKIDKRLTEIASIPRPAQKSSPTPSGVADNAATRIASGLAGRRQKGTLAVIFKGGKLDVYVNGQRVHSSEGGGLRSIPLVLAPGDCLLFRVSSKYVYRNMRFAFMDAQNRALFVSNPTTSVIRTAPDPSAPAPSQMFAGEPARRGKSSKEPGWDAAKLPEDAAWIDVPAKNTTFEIATVVPGRSGVATADDARANAQFQPGKWVDVLELVDPKRDSVQGNWSRAGTEISSEPSPQGRIAIPIAGRGSYDLEAEFTRFDTDGDVNFIFTIAGHQTMMMFSAHKGAVSGLHMVDGQLIGGLTKYVKRPGPLENGHRYRMLLSIRELPGGQASVDVSLDGQPYLPHWEGNPASLGFDTGTWGLHNATDFGLVAQSAPVTFYSVRIRKVIEPTPLKSLTGPKDAVLLQASQAKLHGDRIKYEPEINCIGYWMNAQDWVEWDAQIDKPGRYEVTIISACDASSAGSEYVITAGSATLSGKVKGSGNWIKFDREKLGTIEIPNAGPINVAVKVKTKSQYAVMNLRAIELRPEERPRAEEHLQAEERLPAEEQVAAVVKKLEQLNPGFDGKETHKIENGEVTAFSIATDDVSDISPLRELAGLKRLTCGGSAWNKQGKLTDLSPLKQLKLAILNCPHTPVADLSPVAGMPLISLNCNSTAVADLTPLRGMPLAELNLGSTQVTDLSPLTGLPLTKLAIDNTPVTDLAPLAGLGLIHLSLERSKVTDLSPLKQLNLEHVAFTPANIAKGIELLRQMKSLTQIGTAWNAELPPDEFWKKYDAGEFNK